MSSPLDPASLEALKNVTGYVYPNQLRVQWGILIVVYPFLSGLDAGAFTLDSLNRLFNVRELRPIYRLALLTSLAYMLVAPLPLLFHLLHPERCLEIMVTPHFSSPMAMFGFVYGWYLMVVLLLGLWYEYRGDIVRYAYTKRGWLGLFYRTLTLGVTDTSPKALELDEKAGKVIAIIGIPSAFLMTGYVGFIFGANKANPWWGTVMMPVIFILSAVLSGIALVLVLYLVTSRLRKVEARMDCLDSIGRILFYTLIVDFVLESLNWFHQFYKGDEAVPILTQLATGKLFFSLVVVQLGLGTVLPLLVLGWVQLFKSEISDHFRKGLYLVTAVLLITGVLAVFWNVVIGGQLFSKTLVGFTTFQPELIGRESLLTSLVLLTIPLFVLGALIRLFPPWNVAGKD